MNRLKIIDETSHGRIWMEYNNLPGAGLASMGTRSFGSATQEARQAGASMQEQFNYGMTRAAAEVLSEKLFDVGKLFGGGAADDIAEKLVGKLAKTDAGRTVVRTLLSGAGEGAEEDVTDLVEPAIRAIYDSGASAQESYLTPEGRKELAAQAGYDALVGGALGLAGGVGVLKGVDAQKNAALRQQDDARLFSAALDNADAGQVQRWGRKDAPQNGPVDGTQLLIDYMQRNGGESTAVNTDPAKHTAAEQRVIDEYQGAVDEKLRSVLETYQTNPKPKFSRHSISNVSEKQAVDAARILGGNYSGYVNAINTNGIAHILKEHGADGTVDHSMGDLNDLARIGYVLNNYDNVSLATYESGDQKFSREFRDKNNAPAPMLVYSKKVNGTYYVVEAIPDTEYKKFWVVSAYMNKKGSGTQAPNAQSPGNTPDASLASSLPVTGASQTADATAPALTAKPENANTPITVSITDSAQKSNSNLPEGTGAASRGFAGESFGNDTAPTQTHSTNPMYTEAERAIPGLRLEDSTHQVHHDRDVDYQAQERFESDYDGEKQDLFFHKQNWDDVDQNLALRIIANEVARARETGDYSEVVRLHRENEARGTEQGQALRQRKRFADSAAGIVAKAATDLSDAQRTRNITEQEKNSVMQDVARYAEEWENITQGEVSRVIDLIKELNATRKTGGFFNGKKTSGTLSKALDAVAAQEGGSRWISCD